MASMFAQDVITLKNGGEIQAIVQEIGINEVKYKRFDNPNGPNYTLEKSGIVMIQYANGSIDEFAVHVFDAVENTYEQPFITNEEAKTKQWGRRKPGKEWNMLHDFEIKMKEQGFTRRIVAYDFLPEEYDILTYYWMSVGMWFNFDKKIVALRLSKDNWQEIYIPFDKIKSLDIDEGVFEKGRIQGGIIQTHYRIDEKSSRFHIWIETDTKTHVLKLYDAVMVSFKTTDPYYQAILRCAQAIYNEINFCIRYSTEY